GVAAVGLAGAVGEGGGGPGALADGEDVAIQDEAVVAVGLAAQAGRHAGAGVDGDDLVHGIAEAGGVGREGDVEVAGADHGDAGLAEDRRRDVGAVDALAGRAAGGQDEGVGGDHHREGDGGGGDEGGGGGGRAGGAGEHRG